MLCLLLYAMTAVTLSFRAGSPEKSPKLASDEFLIVSEGETGGQRLLGNNAPPPNTERLQASKAAVPKLYSPAESYYQTFPLWRKRNFQSRTRQTSKNREPTKPGRYFNRNGQVKLVYVKPEDSALSNATATNAMGKLDHGAVRGSNHDSNIQSDSPHNSGLEGVGKFLGRVPFLHPGFASETEEDWNPENPTVLCDAKAMTITSQARGGGLLLLDRGDAPPIPFSELPSDCGYTLKRNWRDLVLVAPYDGCYMTEEDGNYVLSLLWLGTPVKMTCPVVKPPSAPPVSVLCSAFGMALKVEIGEEGAKELKIKVKGAVVPFMSAKCTYPSDGHSGQVVIYVPFSTCEVLSKDGAYTLSVFSQTMEFEVSCPAVSNSPVSPHSASQYLTTAHAASTTAVTDVTITYPALPMPEPLRAPPFPGYSHTPTKLHPLGPAMKPHKEVPRPHTLGRNPPGRPASPKHPIPQNLPGKKTSWVAASVKPRPQPSGFHHQPPQKPTYKNKSPVLSPSYSYYYDIMAKYYPHLLAPGSPKPTSLSPTTRVGVLYNPIFPGPFQAQFPYPYCTPPNCPFPPVPLTPSPQPPRGVVVTSPRIVPVYSAKLTPSVKCLKNSMMITLPSVYPGSISVLDEKNKAVLIRNTLPKCSYVLKVNGTRGVILLSPLPSCHTRELMTSWSIFLKFWDSILKRLRVLEFQCPKPAVPPTTSSFTTSTIFEDEDESLLAFKPHVLCSEHYMSVDLPAGFLPDIHVKGEDSGTKMNLKDAPNHCGYSMNTASNGVVTLVLQFTSCHMTVKDNMHIIYVIAWNKNRQPNEMKLTCLVRPEIARQECDLPTDQRILCGSGSSSLAECYSLGCCFCSFTQFCYYPLDECTVDHHFVFIVPSSLTDPPLTTTSLFAGNNVSCTPEMISSSFALFKIPLNSCGVHKYRVGETVVYLLEIFHSIQSKTLNYGTITRDPPLRLLVECRYVPGSSVSVGYLVKTPSLVPSVQAQGVFGVQLRIATDGNYTSFYPQYHRPLRLLLGKPLHLEVRLLNPPDPIVVLLVHYCVAYPRSAQSAWVLIYDGCPNELDDAPLQTPPPHPTLPKQTRRFTTTTFQFLPADGDSDLDEEIYFMCSTEVCSPTDGPCVEGCFKSR